MPVDSSTPCSSRSAAADRTAPASGPWSRGSAWHPPAAGCGRGGPAAWPGEHSPDGDLAVICGACIWIEVELFGRQKQIWLTTFLELPPGIPSHNTFGRDFARLDPQPLEGCFTRGVQSLAAALRVQVGTVDGKEARCSHDAGRSGRPYTWSVLGRPQQVWSWDNAGWTAGPTRSRPSRNGSRRWCWTAAL